MCGCDTLINHIMAGGDGFLPDVCIFCHVVLIYSLLKFLMAEIAECERLGKGCESVQKGACVCFPHSWEGQSRVKCKFGRRDYNTKYSIGHDCQGPQCGVSCSPLVVARAVTALRARETKGCFCVFCPRLLGNAQLRLISQHLKNKGW